MRKARVLCCAVAAMVVAGCQGAGVSPGTTASVSRAAEHGAGSWISQAKSSNVIWTIDTNVYGYSLKGKQVAELQGFTEAVGLCSDPSSDLYVVDAGEDVIWEYHPGQSRPFGKLYDIFYTPNACAFDPTTGNLAIANNTNVTILPPASGTPVMYENPNMTSYSFVDYDKSGNLYVDGYGAGSSFQLAELRAGGSSLTSIAVSGIGSGEDSAAGLVWDGHDLAVADGLNDVIYRIAISGSSGTILNTWHIAGWKAHDDAVFAIDGTKLLFPENGKVEFFSYPPKARAKKSFSGKIGDVITVTPELIY